MRRTIGTKYRSKELQRALCPDFEFLLAGGGDEEHSSYLYTPTNATYSDSIPHPFTDAADSITPTKLSPEKSHKPPLRKLEAVIEDVQTPLETIIRCLIAYKIKKRWFDIPLDESLQSLTGGKLPTLFEPVLHISC